jgi:hypothetical protein
MQPTPELETQVELQQAAGEVGQQMRSVGTFAFMLGLVLLALVALMSSKIAQGHVESPPGIAKWLPWLPVAILAACAAIFLGLGVSTRASGNSFLRTTQTKQWSAALNDLSGAYMRLYVLIVVGLIVMIASLALHFLSGTPRA